MANPDLAEAIAAVPGLCKILPPFYQGLQPSGSPPDEAHLSTAQRFAWMMEAEAAFAKLKVLFTTAPVLSHSDPACQFIVEVDLSDVSVGVVLSQRSVGDQKLHPCTFFSRHLSGTMMWATVTSWPWSWPSKSGVIGWRVPRSHSWFGLTIKTWPTYRAHNG